MCHRGVWRGCPQLTRKISFTVTVTLHEVSKNVQKILYYEILLESLGILEDSPATSESVKGFWGVKHFGHRWVLENCASTKANFPSVKMFWLRITVSLCFLTRCGKICSPSGENLRKIYRQRSLQPLPLIAGLTAFTILKCWNFFRR